MMANFYLMLISSAVVLLFTALMLASSMQRGLAASVALNITVQSLAGSIYTVPTVFRRIMSRWPNKLVNSASAALYRLSKGSELRGSAFLFFQTLGVNGPLLLSCVVNFD